MTKVEKKENCSVFSLLMMKHLYCLCGKECRDTLLSSGFNCPFEYVLSKLHRENPIILVIPWKHK